MVLTDNGSAPLDRRPPQLPELVVFNASESRRVPAPGTMRALKAETGRSWDELMGEDADAADRFQTMIWMKLRREHPGLRWDDCAEVAVEISDDVDPTLPVGPGSSATSQASAASGA